MSDTPSAGFWMGQGSTASIYQQEIIMRVSKALVMVGLLGSTAASAVTVSFGGQPGGVPLDQYNDPVTSTITKFTNTDHSQLATDDFYNGPGTRPGGDLSPCAQSDNAITLGQTGTGSAGGGGTVGFYQTQDSVSRVRLGPTGAGSCYAVVNDAGGQDALGNPTADLTQGSIALNVSDTSVKPLLYAGFLWGSPDSYNFVKFLKANGDGTYSEIAGLAITYNGVAFGLNSTITGADVYKPFGYTSDPGAAGETFVNFQFTKAEGVNAIEIGNTGNCCFEFTNYADSTDPVLAPSTPAFAHTSFALAVSEPGAALALAAGLSMFGLTRRKRA